MSRLRNSVAGSGYQTPAPSVQEPAEGTDDFAVQVLEGLGQAQKRLPCKFFYDRRGSRLFDRICELPEYYLTRTELAILRRHAGEMAEALGEGCLLVEYGSGSSVKTRLLLDELRRPAGYVPLDISREHLMEAAGRLEEAYPGVRIMPVCADYCRPFRLPRCDDAARVAVYFPGSTIGNFEPQEAREFLRAAAERCGAGGGMLIGVDLKKDPAVLHEAYNDAAGVTAAFNLNILARINRELEGTFDLTRFAHYAFYNPRLGRIEMHLASRGDQVASVAGERVTFRDGETVFTESSYKYTVAEFGAMAESAGWGVERVWTDDGGLFSVQYLTIAG